MIRVYCHVNDLNIKFLTGLPDNCLSHHAHHTTSEYYDSSDDAMKEVEGAHNGLAVEYDISMTQIL